METRNRVVHSEREAASGEIGKLGFVGRIGITVNIGIGGISRKLRQLGTFANQSAARHRQNRQDTQIQNNQQTRPHLGNFARHSRGVGRLRQITQAGQTMPFVRGAVFRQNRKTPQTHS